MKKKILLVDESLTVQKVVALTLDKSRYQLLVAKSKGELIKQVMEHSPHLILISDQINEISAASFPKELESWLGGVRDVPSVVLITGQDIKEAKHYAAVLKKPFSPQALQAVVTEFTRDSASGSISGAETEMARESLNEELEDQRLQKIFNETFADEAELVRETYRNDIDQPEPSLLNSNSNSSSPSPSHSSSHSMGSPSHSGAIPSEQKAVPSWGNAESIWVSSPARPPAGTPGIPSNRGDHQSQLEDLWAGETANRQNEARAESRPTEPSRESVESQLEKRLKGHNLDEMVDRVLMKVVPPIVERMVKERLDKLLKEQEQFVELKP